MSLAAAILAARGLQQSSLEEWLPALGHPGTITIDGIDYACAINLSGIRARETEQGTERTQTFRADVRKAVLATQPAKNTLITASGFEFFVDPEAEQVDNGLTWIIRARRTV